MFCESCGSKLGSASKFCASCGNPVALEQSLAGDLVDAATELIENQEWAQALETLWTEIDSGNEEARIALAKLFDDNSLHSFSQDHWVFLLENSPSESVREIAASGVAGNKLFTWNVDRAASIAEEFGLSWLGDKIQATKENHRVLSEDLDPQVVATELENMASEDAALLEKLEKKYKLEDQLELIRLREGMANLVATLSFTSRTYQGVSVTTSFGVQRRLKDLLPNPADSWYFLADAIALALPDLVDSKRKKDQENLNVLRKLGLHALNNMFLFRGGHSLENEREQFVVQNIAGALGRAGFFAGFILAGLIPDEA